MNDQRRASTSSSGRQHVSTRRRPAHAHWTKLRTLIRHVQGSGDSEPGPGCAAGHAGLRRSNCFSDCPARVRAQMWTRTEASGPWLNTTVQGTLNRTRDSLTGIEMHRC